MLHDQNCKFRLLFNVVYVWLLALHKISHPLVTANLDALFPQNIDVTDAFEVSRWLDIVHLKQCS